MSKKKGIESPSITDKPKRKTKAKPPINAQETPKRKVGRPTSYNEAMATRICEIVATNPEGLKKLCLKYPELPEQITINQWRAKYPEFATQYAQAKRLQAELLAESIEDIIDDAIPDIYYDERGNRKLDSGLLGLTRLRVDSRKWTASKLAPKIYGDKLNDDTKQIAQTLIEKLLEK